MQKHWEGKGRSQDTPTHYPTYSHLENGCPSRSPSETLMQVIKLSLPVSEELQGWHYCNCGESFSGEGVFMKCVCDGYDYE